MLLVEKETSQHWPGSLPGEEVRAKGQPKAPASLLDIGP